MKMLYYIALLLLSLTVFGQEEDAWVYFTDKPDAGYYLANPLEMLSQKALDRRAVQGIVLDIADVPVHGAYIAQIEDFPGISVMAKSKWLNCVHVRGTEEDINSLASLNFVDSIDFANRLLNTSGRPFEISTPKSVNKIMETAADFSYGNASNQIQMLNGHLLHQQDFTGAGMTIAVLDNGFPGVNTGQPFQRLFDNNLILGGYNFVSGSDFVYTGGDHGTMVLSTIGGYTEGQLVGTAPDAFYYLFVTEDTAGENPLEESYWVEAAEMADSLGVDVINTSLGYFVYDNQNYNYSYADMDGQTAFITRGANVAFTRGMLCVTSAGNSANTSHPNIGVPADAPNTLTVGAVDQNEFYATFSSLGPSSDGRVKPDVMARGVAAAISNVQGGITAANGTSFSSPITAGLVACLWQALPELTNAEILQIVRQSADRYNFPNVQFGFGIPDFAMALNIGLGMKEDAKEPFRLYPNPSNAIVNLSFPKNTFTANISLYNSLGRKVLEQEISGESASFNISLLASGIYNYRIESGHGIQAGKIIKE